MKAPRIDCPACLTVRHRVIDGQYVCICGIILRDDLAGKETYPNFEIVPSHCKTYTKCQVWRDEKDEGWKHKIGAGKKYSTVEKKEKIII